MSGDAQREGEERDGAHHALLHTRSKKRPGKQIKGKRNGRNRTFGSKNHRTRDTYNKEGGRYFGIRLTRIIPNLRELSPKFCPKVFGPFHR